MEKLAVGPGVDPRRVSLKYSVAHNLEAVANCLGKPVGDVTVLILDRPRHAQLVREIREAGARIRMISDGDVGGAIETAKPGAPVDVLMGARRVRAVRAVRACGCVRVCLCGWGSCQPLSPPTHPLLTLSAPPTSPHCHLLCANQNKTGVGGTPEGVIAAAALKCMGGHIEGRLWPRDDADRAAIAAAGLDCETILSTDDLVRGDDVFFAATGVSDSDLVRGVRFTAGGASTNSIVMRARSGTVRYIETFHRWSHPRVKGYDS